MNEILKYSEACSQMISSIAKVIVGKEPVVKQAVLVLVAGGHLLIEDVPGVGKTTLAKALALVVGGDYKRIQFTPDLLPSDVTGTSIFDQTTREFKFVPGPVFANVLLADEINRATPKTQSSLLEAMEERHVTVDGREYTLPKPFFVIATQNNIELMGTFPLPEAQLDRFFGRISIGYPDRNAELSMLNSQQQSHPISNLIPLITIDELIGMQRITRAIEVNERVREYIVDIVRATRDNPLSSLGASPRAALHLQNGAQAVALLNAREFVTPDDVKEVAPLILSHRLTTRSERGSMGASQMEIMNDILRQVPAPVPTK